MTAEYYLDNAINAYQNGKSFEEFWDDLENKALARDLLIQPEHVWEMAQYVIDYLKSLWQEEAVEAL